jgi:hypothetical protein
MTGGGLEIWTVYDHPSDYPASFVARKSVVGASMTTMTHDMFVADTLDELRALLPRGLYRIHRYEQDDPKIVEVWL